MHVVWFKRDLRTHDHECLTKAAQAGNVLPLYIVEPELWQQPDMSYRHYAFLRESLKELYYDLKNLGQPLIIRVGNVTDILTEIHHSHGIDGLWSHQETWNGWTYKRDIAVSHWCKKNAITWHQPVHNGVIRKQTHRNGWSTHWEKHMSLPQWKAPLLTHITVAGDKCPNPEELGLADDDCQYRQQGGRTVGLSLLSSFLTHRGQGYTKEMSSPVTAFDSCSRISSHLAFGTLSMREVVHTLDNAITENKQLPYGSKGTWNRSMRSFAGRLHWHCHFIQKLEDEPRLEFENLHYGYNNLREKEWNEDFFQAWKTGTTGYPMIDACMRALIATGWINFRMRAMLMSFASYHLWLHWRKPALHLATLFTDYEPGIHYPQAQMQSGTTGINAIRIYNPIKQGIDQDPNGIFIKRWIPELSNVPVAFVHTPWICSELMNGYPMPIVDEAQARTQAAQRIHRVKKDITNRLIATGIVEKHASRKPRSQKKRKVIDDSQQSLPFE